MTHQRTSFFAALTAFLLFAVAATAQVPPPRGTGAPDARVQDYRVLSIDASRVHCGTCGSTVSVKVQNIYKNTNYRVPVELTVWQAGVSARTYPGIWNPRSGVEVDTLMFQNVKVDCDNPMTYFKVTIKFDDRTPTNNTYQTQAQIRSRCAPPRGSGPPAPRTGSTGTTFTSTLRVTSITPSGFRCSNGTSCQGYATVKLQNLGNYVPGPVNLILQVVEPGKATQTYRKTFTAGVAAKREAQMLFNVYNTGCHNVTLIANTEGASSRQGFKRTVSTVSPNCPN